MQSRNPIYVVLGLVIAALLIWVSFNQGFAGFIASVFGGVGLPYAWVMAAVVVIFVLALLYLNRARQA